MAGTQSLDPIVRDCARHHETHHFDDLSVCALNPTARQRNRVVASGDAFAGKWDRLFVQDKFGSSTTHWNQLQDRIRRGVGSPCPLLLVGIPASLVHQVLAG